MLIVITELFVSFRRPLSLIMKISCSKNCIQASINIICYKNKKKKKLISLFCWMAFLSMLKKNCFMNHINHTLCYPPGKNKLLMFVINKRIMQETCNLLHCHTSTSAITLIGLIALEFSWSIFSQNCHHHLRKLVNYTLGWIWDI